MVNISVCLDSLKDLIAFVGCYLGHLKGQLGGWLSESLATREQVWRISLVRGPSPLP